MAGPAEWMTAIGTVGTAALAVFVTGRDQVDRRRRLDDVAREQARLVTLRARPVSGLGTVAGVYDWQYRVTVVNGSDEAITNCTVILVIANPDRLREVTDEAHRIRQRATYQVDRVLPAGSSPHLEFELTLVTPAEGDNSGQPAVDVYMAFTDAQGRAWTRLADNSLALDGRGSKQGRTLWDPATWAG